MKRNLLSGIFAFFGFLITAQAYQPFDTNVVWNTLRTSTHYYSSTCRADDMYSFYVKGYLINNGIMWHKVYYNKVEQPSYYYAVPQGPTPCGPAVSGSITNGFAGMFCNDIANKKVFFVPSATLAPNFTPGPLNILFDFLNKGVGDMIAIGNGGNPSTTVLAYNITSIDSVLFENKYHKRFRGIKNNPNSYQPGGFIIEGIGGSGGVFLADFYVFSSLSTPLQCFSGSSETKYIVDNKDFLADPTTIRDTTSCDWLFTGIAELAGSNRTIRIYPNPTKDQVFISLPSALPNCTLSVRDVSGREVKSLKLSVLEKEQVIDLKGLETGVYLLTIVKDQRTIYTTKLVKQD